MDFLTASLPLFEEDLIEVLEWSFDAFEFNANIPPEWLSGLLAEFSQNNSLLGHGVHYSLFDAKWTARQEEWLKHLKAETKRYNYSHISEHFGFMSSNDAHKGFPLPLSLNKQSLSLGINRLQQLQEVAKVPVGIENLALSFSAKDVEEQGDFIRQLLEAVNGFIVLDLHNIYCQAENFDIDMIDLIKMYPLHMVKEIHVSGGSWEKEGKNKRIRRDTHDDSIPEAIFDVLPFVLKSCLHTEFLIYERLGNTFYTDDDYIHYQQDFLRLKDLINRVESSFTKKIWGVENLATPSPQSDLQLYEAQRKLCQAFSNPTTYSDMIKSSSLVNWSPNDWKKEMVETAIKLSKKWN